jgi:hypothetical protein
VSEGLEFVFRAVLIGLGASLVLDLWTMFLKRCFDIQGLSYRMVGRWLCHIPRGRLVHDNIGKAEQPGLGAGIAASKTPKPNVARLRSLMAHAVFGLGLYLSALVSALLVRP